MPHKGEHRLIKSFLTRIKQKKRKRKARTGNIGENVGVDIPERYLTPEDDLIP
jgi:hypothetical protein